MEIQKNGYHTTHRNAYNQLEQSSHKKRSNNFEEQYQILEKIYYDPKSSGSFSSSRKLYSEARNFIPTLRLVDVENWMKSQKTITAHKKRLKRFPRNKFISSKLDRNWQSDLIDLSKFSNSNNGVKYLLTTIDILSKYAWVLGLKDKKPKSIIVAFKKILKEGRKPSILTTDSGSEFVNQFFSRFLKNSSVLHLITRNTETKAANIERFNRTLMEKLSKYMTAFSTESYIDILDQAVFAYNHTIHSRTKFKPIDVTESNEKKVFNNLYNIKVTIKPPKFNKDDIVKLSKLKSTYEKGYTKSWTDEIFRIDKILNTSPNIRYTVRDTNNSPLIGSFYNQELQKVTR